MAKCSMTQNTGHMSIDSFTDSVIGIGITNDVSPTTSTNTHGKPHYYGLTCLQPCRTTLDGLNGIKADKIVLVVTVNSQIRHFPTETDAPQWSVLDYARVTGCAIIARDKQSGHSIEVF